MGLPPVQEVGEDPDELVAFGKTKALPHTEEDASSKVKGSRAWREMMQYREEHQRVFENRYHKKSNAESTNSSFKGKYSEFLCSGKWHTRRARTTEATARRVTYLFSVSLIVVLDVLLLFLTWPRARRAQLESCGGRVVCTR